MGAYVELAAPVRAEDPTDAVVAAWERDWLVGERALSPNTVAAYTADVRDFMAFLSAIGIELDWQPFSGHFFQRLRPAFLNSTGLM
ncbi:MAG: site-specific integrase [Adlercreutzia caecimuris]|uniref:site-specific integrase n=1 Tax=Adlercreutzia caecimuris TaxID=671266 RepID=UPI00242DB21B|nr:site-specific integrase [Adlercreutzia caecimuris]MCI9208060.1 site-specific integrase [Adlercreutzia caecimuris]